MGGNTVCDTKMHHILLRNRQTEACVIHLEVVSPGGSLGENQLCNLRSKLPSGY